MKKFYIIFFAGFVILSALLYFSIWWFIGGGAIIAIATIYHFYNARLKANDASIEELELQVGELQTQLDNSLRKEEKSTKEAIHIRNAKQELLTVISHEIRTPMNGVLGMTLLLGDTALTTEQKEYLDTIQRSGQHLLSTVNNLLVNDMLHYSKLDKRNKKLEPIDFNLLDTIEEVLDLFADKAGKIGLDLLYRIDENVPLQLTGDNKRLRIVLMNLVENAVKFTQRGEVEVNISLLNHADNHSVICFEISDSGIGMTPVQLNQLFYSMPGKEFADNDKFGEGLIICRKQVELMGGKIEATSKLGEGSVFTFNIPFLQNSATNHSTLNQDSLSIFINKNVLIVDDNLKSRMSLTKQLKALKMKVVAVESGTEAAELLSASPFDLIVTDMNLPQFSGVQFANSIKAKYPQLPIVLLNHAGHDLPRSAQDLFTQILSKPVRQQILMNSILAIFNKPMVENANEAETFATKFPLQILIAEDNLINQKIATKILTKLGYDPKIANNGREALAMLEQGPFNIVLMDVQMPVMDGLEATKAIRSSIRQQPIIMAMTANVLQGDRDACMQAGMDDYISKPINLDELIGRLEKWSLFIKERQKS